MPDATDKRSDARRNRAAVLDAAVRLLAERPDASMAHIADASGVGRTTVYRHFPNREVLLAELFTRVVEDATTEVQAVVAEPGEGAEDVLRRLAVCLAALASRFRFLAAHRALGDEAIARAQADGQDPLGDWVTAAASRGDLRTGLSPEWVTVFFKGLIDAAATEIAEGRTSEAEAGARLGDAFVALCL